MRNEKTEVFISWSGETSRLVARALANWLPDTLQSIECWMSDVDIGAGAQWSAELEAHLDTCSFGILCLAPDNLDSRWMLFEAGYLAKGISGSRIVPYLFALKPTDVTYPLAQFQAAETTKEGTLKLITSLNAASQQPMSDERVARLLDHWWSDLDKKIGAIRMPDRELARPSVTSADQMIAHFLKNYCCWCGPCNHSRLRHNRSLCIAHQQRLRHRRLAESFFALG